MVGLNKSTDASKAALVARDYAIKISGNMATYTFKLLSVQPNSEENVWKVECEFISRASDANPAKYMIKVNIRDGTVESITEQK